MTTPPMGATISPDGNYWWDGTDWQLIPGEVHTIGEVTVTGDASRQGDPNSADDAFADGYMTGSAGHDADSSRYSDAVKGEYMRGWNQGAGQFTITHHEDEAAAVAAEGVAHGAAELGSHAFELGPLGVIFAAFTMSGDTKLHERPAYICACGYSSHGGGGDEMLNRGFWHGEPTMDYDDAHNEMLSHAGTWNHNDGVGMYQYQEGNVTQI